MRLVRGITLEVDLTAYLDGLTIWGGSGREYAHPSLEFSFKLGEFTVQRRQRDVLKWLTPPTDYVAKTQIEFADPSVVNPPRVYEFIDALITCFRLFKVGYVTAYPVVAMSRLPENATSRPNQFSFGSTARQPEGGMAYWLEEDEIADLVEFGRHVFPLISSPPHASLRMPAFRFFNRGVDDMARSDYPLAIADFVSCMEALISPDVTELRHQLSELVALITERNPIRRRDAYLKCKDLYDKRSRVVHGGSLKNAVQDVNAAQEFAAKTIRFYLGYFSKGLNKKDILKDALDVIYGAKRDFPDFAFSLIQDEATFRRM